MQEIDSVKTSETNDKIKYHISKNLNGLNEKSRNYIKDIVALINKEIGVNKIISPIQPPVWVTKIRLYFKKKARIPEQLKLP